MPMAPPLARSGESEFSRTSFSKSSPARARSARPCAFFCAAATWASVAFSGRATSTCARLRFCKAAFLVFELRWSRRYSSASLSLILTFDSTSRSRRRVSSSWSRRSLAEVRLRNAFGGHAAAQLDQADLVLARHGLLGLVDRHVVDLDAVFLGKLQLRALDDQALEHQARELAARHAFRVGVLLEQARHPRLHVGVGDRLGVDQRDDEFSRPLHGRRRRRGGARCTGGGPSRGPARMMSVMPLPERKPCAPDVAAIAARQPRVMMERMCFMALLSQSSQS
jgi:hypothetical protein